MFHLDHIICLRNGGKDELDNLQALCPNCHAEKTKNEILNANSGDEFCDLDYVIKERKVGRLTMFYCQWADGSKSWEPMGNLEFSEAFHDFLNRRRSARLRKRAP